MVLLQRSIWRDGRFGRRSSDGLEAGGERFTEIDGEGAEGEKRLGCGRFEDALHFGCDLSALLVAEHAERAGELVGDAESFYAGGFVKLAGGCDSAEFVEEVEAFPNGGKVLLPELGEYGVDLGIDLGVDTIRDGFFRRQWCN
jgi:hypothetical protein